jgi:chromate reductase, NAD(P)H dehydrogenase (quinone)
VGREESHDRKIFENKIADQKKMTRILAISGSLRAKSTNKSLLLAIAAIAPKDIEISIFDGIQDLPYFNPDLDIEGAVLPREVQKLRQEIAGSSAIIFSTPEYAHGIPGVLKNALDWLVSSTEFLGKPVGLFFGSAGDPRFARESLIEILNTMSVRIVPGAVVNIPGVRTKIGEKGDIFDRQVEGILAAALDVLLKTPSN